MTLKLLKSINYDKLTTTLEDITSHHALDDNKSSLDQNTRAGITAHRTTTKYYMSDAFTFDVNALKTAKISF